MKTTYTTAALAVALAAGTAAQGVTLTFDSLVGTNSASALGPNMTGDGQYIAYTEAGYIVTLNTTNLPANTSGAHIGDGGSGGSFGWLGGSHNPGAFVTLTKVGGGAFNFLTFDYVSSWDPLSIAGSNGDTLVRPGDNYQPGAVANFYNVTSVSFTSTNFTYIELDNITVTDIGTAAVPEPATWAMMLVGLGMVGAAVRRRQKVAVSFG